MEQQTVIEIKDLKYAYPQNGGKPTLEDISLSVSAGEMLVILGGGGSGKSTLAKLLCGQMPVQGGALTIDGIDAADKKRRFEIWKKCYGIFQYPDDSFVSSYVGEDAAYNTGRNAEHEGVLKALGIVGLRGCSNRPLCLLSRGERQRTAIAGALTAQREIYIFDEAEAGLDSRGRRDMLNVVDFLHQAGKTLIFFTHETEYALMADRVLILANGKLLSQGKPRELLGDDALLKQAGLLPTLPVKLYNEMKKAGVELPLCPMSLEELAEALCQYH